MFLRFYPFFFFFNYRTQKNKKLRNKRGKGERIGLDILKKTRTLHIAPQTPRNHKKKDN